MKKMMMIVAMAVCSLAANAQNEVGQLTLQPKIGINLAWLSDTEVTISTGVSSDTESGKVMGDFALGVEAEYGLMNNFSVAAGILYSRQGTNFAEYKLYGGPGGSVSSGWDKYEDNLGYLNIPIVANYYFAEGWAFKAGIQPGFLLSAKVKRNGLGATPNLDEDIKSDLNSFDLSIPLGISYEFNNFVIDGRYNLGLTKVNKNGDNNVKNNVVQFTFGYKFSL